MRGAKPKEGVTTGGAVDFVHGSPRGPGGYGEEVVVRGDERGKSSLPAQLALEDTPRWPKRVQLAFTSVPGEWELELVLRGVEAGASSRSRATARSSASCASRPARAASAGPTRSRSRAKGSARSCSRSWPAARSRSTTCGSCAGASSPAETSVVTQAGWRAELLEHTTSSFLVEKKRLATIADLNGFAVTIEYEHVDRGLQVLRTFDLPAHRSLKRLASRDKPLLLREPFVLASSDPALPDLAVVPVELPRTDHFAVDAEGKLTLLGYRARTSASASGSCCSPSTAPRTRPRCRR